MARNLTTLFGVVRYFRCYLREVKDGDRHGYHPLDVSLGLTADRVSWNVLMLAAQLATKMAFAEPPRRARRSGTFVPNAPSTEVIEKTVLGLHQHDAAFVEQAPAPEGYGEVLIIQLRRQGHSHRHRARACTPAQKALPAYAVPFGASSRPRATRSIRGSRAETKATRPNALAEHRSMRSSPGDSDDGHGLHRYGMSFEKSTVINRRSAEYHSVAKQVCAVGTPCSIRTTPPIATRARK